MGAIIGWLVNRLARETHRRPGARVGSRGSPRPARAPRRSAGRRESLRASARVVARDRRGLSPRSSASCAALIPFDRTAIILADDGVGAGDRGCGRRGRDGCFRRALARPVAGSLLSEVTRRGQVVYRKDMTGSEVSRGGGVRRARASLPARRAAVRRPESVGMISLVRAEPDSFTDGRGRVRLAPRPLPGQHGAEHPRVRGRARDGRGAPPALGAPGGLRLPRLARAAEPDGRRHRVGEDAAASAGAS